MNLKNGSSPLHIYMYIVANRIKAMWDEVEYYIQIQGNCELGKLFGNPDLS